MTMDRGLLEAALIGYQRQRDEIDAKMTELHRALDESPKRPVMRRVSTHRMSVEGRAKVAEAQRKRWAAYHDGNRAMTSTKKSTRKKRKLSAAAVKRISEATKKRWDAYRAAKAKLK